MDIKIDAKAWTLRNYRDFTNAIKEQSFDGILALVSKVIVSWPFDGDPRDTDYWLDNLNVLQWQEISTAVSEELSKQFNLPKK